MKRIFILVAALSMLLVATSAQAATKVHGGFSADSSGCAACHITHAAEAAKLLLSGTNQTEFCFACHGAARPKSPYDTRNGIILDGANFSYAETPPWAAWVMASDARPSYTGGFVYTYNFNYSGNADVPFDGDIFAFINNGTQVGDDKMFLPSNSAHNVETITLGQAAWNSANKIPGGTAAISGSKFVCSSCHDPHGFNSSASGGGVARDNPRLLRKDLPARENIDVYINVDITVDGDGNMTNGTLRTTGYPDATINKWCGGCHDALDVGKNAGSHKGSGPEDTRYRHAMGITVTTPPSDITLGKGLPLATGNKLICISCHRVHGTAASMSAVANSWMGQNYDNPSGSNVSKTGAALLRMDNRDVCYKCHGAAEKNTNPVSGARQAVSY